MFLGVPLICVKGTLVFLGVPLICIKGTLVFLGVPLICIKGGIWHIYCWVLKPEVRYIFRLAAILDSPT